MKKKVLIVDDSPVVLAMLDDMLSGLNYDVSSAASGYDAWKMVEETKYNMIITDMNMPGMDGIEFTKRAKLSSNCKFVPIVMLSSDGDAAKIAEAKKTGVSTFIKKPVKENQIQTIMNIVLGPS